MTNVRVARRYAEALVEMAEEQKNVDAVVKDLEVLRGLMKESRELLLFMKSPIINRHKKQDVLRALFGGKLHDATTRFLDVLADKGREEFLPEVIDQFFLLRDERQGIVHVDVRVAADLSREQTALLQKKLETYTNKRVRITFGLDKQLRGGFIARVGDTVFDGSVKRQLELLRQRFSEGNGTN